MIDRYVREKTAMGLIIFLKIYWKLLECSSNGVDFIGNLKTTLSIKIHSTEILFEDFKLNLKKEFFIFSECLMAFVFSRCSDDIF